MSNIMLVLTKIKTNIPSFHFSQIKHIQSFQTNGLEFTIIIIMTLLVEKPCLCNSDVNYHIKCFIFQMNFKLIIYVL
jgi:hypothetical protein